LLHLVVIKSVVPRAGKRSEAGFLDLTLMEYLIKGRQINLPKLMVEHISHAVSRANHALPYGMCLTKVLKHFQVPLCANEKNDRMDYFGESFLRKVELNLVDDVWWLGKGATRRRDVPAEVDDDVLPTGVDVPVEMDVPRENPSMVDPADAQAAKKLWRAIPRRPRS
ncbi:hypothetical protein Dimus_005618, partial [Dionaea muscipula]